MEDKGKSMMHAVYILRYAKGTSQTAVMSNSEKNKPVALTVIELHLSEDINKSVSQQKTSLNGKIKFCGNLLEAFWVMLWAWLYLTNTFKVLL